MCLEASSARLRWLVVSSVVRGVDRVCWQADLGRFHAAFFQYAASGKGAMVEAVEWRVMVVWTQ